MTEIGLVILFEKGERHEGTFWGGTFDREI